MTSLKPSLPPIPLNIYTRGYREERTASKLLQSSKRSFEWTWVFSSRDHWENKRDCQVQVYNGIILRHLDFVYCTWSCSEDLRGECRGWSVWIRRNVHTSVPAAQLLALVKGLPGRWATGRGGPACWDGGLFSPRKRAKWEGSGESGQLRELVLDNGSFWGEGKGFH